MAASDKVKVASAIVFVCMVVFCLGSLTGFQACRVLWSRVCFGMALGHVGLGTEVEDTDPVGAMYHYSKAIGAAPGLSLPYLKLGDLLENQGHKELALSVYEDVVQNAELHSYDLNLVHDKIDSLRQELEQFAHYKQRRNQTLLGNES